MRSAFDGHIDEIPFILVDNFENDFNKSAYFLSHYHGDHVQGLAGEFFRARLKRNNVFIYASKVTNAIIKEECPRLAPYVKVLELGTNAISIKTDDKEVFLTVKTLPAGHSLGSTMFLFEYNNKKVLYTGDFRISRNSVSKYKHFHSNGEPVHLDTMYVDTTFQDVPSFPRRMDVVRNAVQHIQNWLNRCTKHKVVLLTSAAYGYECVCNEIYKKTGIKTYVGDSYWRIYSQFPKDIYGMTNNPTSRIHLIKKYSYKGESNPLELQVYFSALKWRDKKNIEEEFLTIIGNRIEVCFSTHCGRDELIHFINYFKPNRIVGFPEPFIPDVSLTVLEDSFPDSEEMEDDFRIAPKKRRVVREKEVKVGERVSKKVLEEALNW